MKHKLFIFLITLTFLTIFCCSSCQQKNSSVIRLQYMEEKSTSYSFSSSTILIKENQNSIEIYHPVLSNELQNCSKINTVITDNIYKYLEEFYGAEFSNISMNVNYEIMFLNDHYISILFSGFSNRVSAAYPIDFKFALNIQLDNSQILELSNIIEIDDDFVSEFKSNFKNQNSDTIENYIDNYTTDEIKSLLKQNQFSNYFTNDELGVIFNVPNAVGDYVVVTVPF